MSFLDIFKDDQDLNLSEEVIQETTFKRTMTAFNISHIGTREVVFSDIDIPNGSVIHALDSFMYDSMFSITNPPLYPYLNNLFGRPFFVNVKDFNETQIEKNKSRMRYYPSRLNSGLIELKNKLMKKFQVVPSVNQVFAKNFKHLVLNYYPVSTLEMIGPKEKIFDEYEMLMSTVIDNIKNSPDTALHFINIPISNIIDHQDLFMYLTRNRILTSNITQNRNVDMMKLFSLDWLSYLTGHTFENFKGMLNQIPEHIRSKIYFIMISSDYKKSIIVNLSTTKEILNNRAHYSKFFEYMNSMFKIVSPSTIFSTIHEVNTIVESGVNTDEENETESVSKTDSKVDDDTGATISEIVTTKTDDNDVSSVITDSDTINTTNVKPLIGPKPIIKTASTKPTITDTDEINEIHDTIYDTELVKLESELYAEDSRLNALFDQLVMSQSQTVEEVVAEIETNSKIVLSENEKKYSEGINIHNFINDNLNDVLERDHELTPKQKERAKDLYIRTLQTKVNIDGKEQPVIDLLKKDSVKPIEKQTTKTNMVHQLDTSIGQQTVFGYTEQYRKDILPKDMIGSLVSLSKNGLFLNNYEETIENNAFNRVKHITAKFDSSNGKKHTVKFKVPIIDEDGMVINGIKYNLRMQQINLPICKVSETRVSLTSNYNKTLVEKNSYLNRSVSYAIKKTFTKSPDLLSKYKVVIDTNTYKGSKEMPIDYIDISTGYKAIENDQYKLYFKYDDVYNHFNLDNETIKKFEGYYDKNKVIFIGTSNKNKNVYLFMDVVTNLVHEVDISEKKILRKRNIFAYIFPTLKATEYQQPNEFCHLKILDKNIPIVVILGYRFGLLKLLKEKNIKYKLIPKGKRIDLQEGDMTVKFADFTMVFNRYPLTTSLLLNGLNIFDTKSVTFADMDNPSTYNELFSNKGIKTNYLKGINSFFEFFVDPMTFDVLKSMGEPVTPKGLLLRSIEMLSTSKYVEVSESKNARIRGEEKIPAVVYNEISRQYAQYLNDRRRNASFSINTESIFMRIIQDNAVVLTEDINPVHDLKTKTSVTHLGFGGRTEEAFVETDRKFPRDGVGLISEATPDSGKVSLNYNLPPNANISNTRGMFNIVENPNDVDASSILSVTGLLMPGTVNSDPKRSNFLNIQMSHIVPQENSKTGRVRTGYEAVIPHITSSSFCISAKQDGVVSAINPSINMITVTYKDGTSQSYKIGNVLGTAGGSYVNHNVILAEDMKLGKKFKQGDIIAYNEGFFQRDKYTNEITFKHGVYTNIAFLESDETIEDASAISRRFAEKLSFRTSNIRSVKLDTSMVILDAKQIGDKVSFADNIMKLSYVDLEQISTKDKKEQNDDVADILEDLQAVNTKAKSNGIITDINIFYTANKEDFHESVRSFINKVEKHYKSIESFTKNSSNGSSFITPRQLPPNTRVGKKALEENSLLIEFVITKDTEHSIGDKMVIGTCLKTVVSKEMNEPIIVEDSSLEVDILFGSKSLYNRIVLGDVKIGITERILDEFENMVKAKFSVVHQKQFMNSVTSTMSNNDPITIAGYIPPLLYHGSGYNTDILKPGIEYNGGVLTQWDDTESNKWLYSTSDKELAISLGFFSAVEKRYPLKSAKVDNNRLYITFEDDSITLNDILDIPVYLYTIEGSDDWIKVNNKVNQIDNEYKTQESIKPKKVEEIRNITSIRDVIITNDK